MGKRVARKLWNSIYVLVPQQRHEVWTNSGDYVGGFATAFIQEQDVPLDLSCLDKQRPLWALPDDADMSQLAPPTTFSYSMSALVVRKPSCQTKAR